jgi:pimeloyl-ACP methyl ester carboxylesterase
MATFCLIHGNWHDGSCWDLLRKPLAAGGHDIVTPDLPIDDPEADWDARIQPALQLLAPIEGRVVIVAHSAASGYGALVASRLDEPLLVHLCPRLNPFDAPPNAPEPFRPNFPFPSRLPDGRNAWERDAAIEVMYKRLPRDVAEGLAENLRPTCAPAGEFPLGGHPEVATSLIFATEDEFFEPDFERFMAREFLGVEPIEIPGGHFPMAEDPEGLADVLDRVADERVD